MRLLAVGQSLPDALAHSFRNASKSSCAAGDKVFLEFLDRSERGPIRHVDLAVRPQKGVALIFLVIDPFGRHRKASELELGSVGDAVHEKPDDGHAIGHAVIMHSQQLVARARQRRYEFPVFVSRHSLSPFRPRP